MLKSHELAAQLLALPDAPVWLEIAHDWKRLPAEQARAFGPDICAGVPDCIVIIGPILQETPLSVREIPGPC